MASLHADITAARKARTKARAAQPKAPEPPPIPPSEKPPLSAAEWVQKEINEPCLNSQKTQEAARAALMGRLEQGVRVSWDTYRNAEALALAEGAFREHQALARIAEDATDGFPALLDRLEAYAADRANDLAREAIRRGTSDSTSAWSNVAEASEREGAYKVVSDDSWGLPRRIQYLRGRMAEGRRVTDDLPGTPRPADPQALARAFADWAATGA
jgi:hypothetical protein